MLHLSTANFCFSDAERAVKILMDKGAKCVILTLGENGAIFATCDDPKPVKVASPSFTCVDSTGAGDAFIGALAFFLSTRKDLKLKRCIEAACYIASDSITRHGTQMSYADADILEVFSDES